MTAEQRKAWAYERLDDFLRAWHQDGVREALEHVREALEHALSCNGWQCGDWQHRHHPNQIIGPETDDCDVLVPCGDCEAYRKGARDSLEVIGQAQDELFAG